ncbi:MAG: hypothetical protein K2P90_00010 [Holosporales bacterium]|nr:hypothetical protein [Holosporales bacterium]
MFQSNKKILYAFFASLLLGVSGWGIFHHQAVSSEEKIFTHIYENNLWGKGSGPGSDPSKAQPYISLLQTVFENPKYKTIVDLGCGDWQLMEKIRIPHDKFYKGFDVVHSVINDNIQKHQRTNVQFYHIHELKKFQNVTGDLLIVKDVLIHWPIKTILFFLQDILPHFKYALLTGDYGSNSDKEMGSYSPLDLQAPPFSAQNLTVLLDYQVPDHNGLKKRVWFYERAHLRIDK